MEMHNAIVNYLVGRFGAEQTSRRLAEAATESVRDELASLKAQVRVDVSSGVRSMRESVEQDVMQHADAQASTHRSSTV